MLRYVIIVMNRIIEIINKFLAICTVFAKHFKFMSYRNLLNQRRLITCITELTSEVHTDAAERCYLSLDILSLIYQLSLQFI